MNKLGLGTNNFRIIGSASPPIMERYKVTDCIGVIGQETVNTIEYPQGTFQLNDRVSYYFNGFNTFGYVLEIDVAATDEAEIYGVGVNSSNCLDNNIDLYAYNSFNGNSFFFTIPLIPYDDDFISQNNEYIIYLFYYNFALVTIDIDGEQDDREVTFSGNLTLNNYNFAQNGEYEIVGRSQAFSGAEVIGLSEQYIITEISFNSTNSYTDNDCNNKYFLRDGSSQSGSTFYVNLRNDDCN